MAETLFPDATTGAGPDLQLLNDDGATYLRRWNLRFRLERALQRLGLRRTSRTAFMTANGVLLHNIVNPDPDRDVHNHPWPAVAIILRGGYRQVRLRPDGVWVMEDVRWINVLHADEYHRIIRVKPNTWTLTFTGSKLARGWGFWVPVVVGGKHFTYGNHVDWRKYLAKDLPQDSTEVDA